MTIIAEIEMPDGNDIVISRQENNIYRVDVGNKENIHGECSAEDIIRYLAMISHELSYKIKSQ